MRWDRGPVLLNVLISLGAEILAFTIKITEISLSDHELLYCPRMLHLYSFLLLFLSLSAFGQNHLDVQKRVTDAFNRRSSDDLLIGSSVGYIDEKGKLEMNFGVVNSSHEKFEVGSVSKTFTGIVIAQLVLEQKIKLSTLLEEVLPELKGTYAGTVSLKLLGNHKARFVRNHPEGDRISEEDIIIFLKTFTPGPKDPAEGEKFYSNLGFTTLGIVISRLTGKSYSDAIRERILSPLEMTETNFLISINDHNSLITPHNILLQPTSADILSDLAGASGGITSSLHDMMKFIEFNYNPDAAVKLAQKECLGFDNNPGEGYIWKNGGMTGYSSIMIIDTVNHRGSIVLSNSNNGPSSERLGLIALGEEDKYIQDLKIESDLSSAVLGQYFNEDFKLYMEVVVTRQGFLGFLLKDMPDDDNARATRLITEDRRKFLLMGRGWSSKDFVQFRINSETGVKEVLLSEFEKNDKNGNPVFEESIFVMK